MRRIRRRLCAALAATALGYGPAGGDPSVAAAVATDAKKESNR
jgi:hypothetical protein